MPGGLRFSEVHLSHLARRARDEPKLSGELFVKDGDHGALKWQKRWMILYQNFLFYFENAACTKPLGLIFLEHATVDVLSLTKLKDLQNQHTLYVAVPEDTEQQKCYLRANSEDECILWLEALAQSSYASVQLEKKKIEAKFTLSSKILEAEQAAKKQLMLQCEDYEERIHVLHDRLAKLSKGDRPNKEEEDTKTESEYITKIKKVQSLVRAWLCRRRFYSIVQNYIKSGHGSSIRQRNQLIFHFVQEEEEYVNDMSTLVTCFLRPFRMAASAKKPPTSHENVNSIFLNCEIILFLHQIFLKGLQTRMENWPTLILGDLFRVLLPMYGIYQEYVRNHHFSLQTLAECKQSSSFNRLLSIHEEKPVCENRSLETFLTLPMHRVPGYIITLHRLLAFTPPDHVDRPSLEHAQTVLENLSLLMHDEVSETENIRQNLSIERQIVGGCEELLDVQQVFIRQGNLIQVQESNKKLKSFGGLGIKPHERKESVRHCFLFSGLLLIAARSSNGKLHLHKTTGKLHLHEVTLIDSIYDDDNVDANSLSSSKTESFFGYEEMALRVVVHPRDGDTPLTVTLVAQTTHERAAWMSDLKQCIENVKSIDNLDSQLPLSSRHCFASVRNDPSLYTDDVDIKYSKCLNSCRVPRIRYASLKRLFERLLDLRFLSIEFLNTFLISYRIFTDARTILDVLENFYQERQRSLSLPTSNGDVYRFPKTCRTYSLNEKCSARNYFPANPGNDSLLDEEYKEEDEYRPDRPTTLQLPPSCYHRRHSSPSALGEGNMFCYLSERKGSDEGSTADGEAARPEDNTDVRTFFPNGKNGSRVRTNSSPPKQLDAAVNNPSGSLLRRDEASKQYTQCNGDASKAGHESDSLADNIPVITMECAASGNRNVRSVSGNKGCGGSSSGSSNGSNKNEALSSKDNDRITKQTTANLQCGFSLGLERSTEVALPEKRPNSCPKTVGKYRSGCLQDSVTTHQENPSPKHSKMRPESLLERRKNGRDVKLGISSTTELKPKRKFSFPRPLSPRLGNSSPLKAVASPGAVVTSPRVSKRRTGSTAAAAAFAAATAGAACSPSSPLQSSHARFTFREVQGPLARVLTVLHHWVIKHRQDFENVPDLQSKLKAFIDKVSMSDRTTNEQRNFCRTILRTLDNGRERAADEVLFERLFVNQRPLDAEVSFDKLSSNMLAEQLTLTEHLLFSRIPSHEFLNVAWMKSDKDTRAPNILRVSQRFNEVSRLVASEILCRSTASSRAAAIEKWVVVADVCRHLSNFNAVLEIISALMSSSVFRLKKTWEKLSKQTKALIDKLQALVSTDGRFKNMRDALRCSNPPCIPYLGFYLTDLAFIEEGTSVTNENGLINFSKMRMIAQVVEEIRHYQEIRYNIQHDTKITSYLLCKDLLMGEDLLYKTSLTWEPKKRPSIRLRKGESQQS